MCREIHRLTATALLRDGDIRDRQLWAQFTRDVADLARHPAYNDLFVTVNGVTDDGDQGEAA